MTVTTTLITRFIPPYLPKKESYKPTHPEFFLIEFGGEEDYTSSLRTVRVSFFFSFLDFFLSWGEWREEGRWWSRGKEEVGRRVLLAEGEW